MGWVETTTSGGNGERDGLMKGAAERTFRVWDYEPSQAILDPTTIENSSGVRLPALNTVHPELPGFLLDRYRIISRDSAVFDLAAEYSNNRRFHFKELLDPARPGFVSWSVSFRRDTMDIPYVKRGLRRVALPPIPQTPPNPPLPVFTDLLHWEREVWKAPVNYTRITLRLNIQSFSGSQRRIIEGQNGKIHILEEYPYLFDAGDVVQVDTSVWTVEYNWTGDPGHAESPWDDPNIGPDIAGPKQTRTSPWLVHQNQLWMRHPFYSVVGPLPPLSHNVQEEPYFDVIRMHELDANGWRALPGVL